MQRHALFFTDPDAKRIYKENVKYTVLRRNSVNGRTYKDDPTIFSWGLLNEPRCETWKASPARALLACHARMEPGLHKQRPCPLVHKTSCSPAALDSAPSMGKCHFLL